MHCGSSVDDGYDSGYAGLCHSNPDEVVEFPGADEREEPLGGFALVAVHDFNCGRCQVSLDYACVLFLYLAWDVLDGGSVFAVEKLCQIFPETPSVVT